VQTPRIVIGAFFFGALWSVLPVAAADPDRGAGAALDRASTEPLADLLKDTDHIHPAAMMALSLRLLQRDRYNEALFWVLEGRLRWYPEHPNSDEYDLHFYLMNILAADFGEYRRNHHIDVAASIKTMNDVLDWDASHPDNFSPRELKEKARAQLKDAIAEAIAHKDQHQRENDEEVGNSQRNAVPDDPYSGLGGNTSGTPYELLAPCDDQKITSFHVGVSKKDDVIRAFGKPDWWDSTDDKKTAIIYGCLGQPPSPGRVAPRLEAEFDFDPNKMLTSVRAPKEQK